ncbi:ceramidase domain-containing protein [Nocardioides sp. 1609]|uniref:ceramidase domain-containing protein n=1 Tax=Nocardioides sp. 1609 TaxID=2508327 RepID=UPI00107065B5|nr:ceramidase domain-containing protein [Nocardioides sp. 1609]
MVEQLPSHRPLVVTVAVAVASLGLLAAAVAGGWLGDDVDRGARFCEAHAGTVRQPVNTLSNLGFVVAGLLVAARAGRPDGLGVGTLARLPALATAYACLVVLLGPASMAMHATESDVGGHLDQASMYLVAGFAVAYAAMRRWRRGPGFLAVVLVGVVAVSELVGLWPAELPVVAYAGNLAFGVSLVLALVWESRLARGGLVLDTRWAWAAAGSLAVAFAIWNTATTGGALCFPTSLYQGHGVWHLLCAVSAWCLFRLYVSERAVGSPPPAGARSCA